jgi:hypothetical protein
LGGGDDIENITILCACCNIQKDNNFINLPSLKNIDAIGWIRKERKDVQVGDFTLAGYVTDIYFSRKTNRINFICKNPPWPARRGCGGIPDGNRPVLVFVGAERLVGVKI